MYKKQMVTDIHCHILPDIDDGPDSWESSDGLLQDFARRGVDRVISTSHFLSPYFDVTAKQLTERFQELEERRGKTPVDVKLGAEVRLSRNFTEILLAETIPTLGASNYVLVELSGGDLPEKVFPYLHELTVRGYIPVIAHPERILALQTHYDLVHSLLKQGVCLQLSAHCFAALDRDLHMADKLAWRLLEDGHAAIIASDSHNTGRRASHLVEAYEAIERRFSEEVVLTLIDNANAIWDNRPLAPVKVPANTGFFRWMKKR